MWLCYEEQKATISELIIRVESDLQKLPAKFATSEQVKVALKNELRNDLKRATEVNLQRLKDLSGYIVTVTSTDGADVINDEVNQPIFYPRY